MKFLTDYRDRIIRFTDERNNHLENAHPEMFNQIEKIIETMSAPDYVIESRTDENVELFYKFFRYTPVKAKYLCVTVKCKKYDNFIITAYFTDTIKKGKQLWKKK